MSALTDKLRDSARRVVARPYAYVTGEWERMSPRDRRWVQVVGVAIVVLVIVFSAYVLFSNVADSEEENAEIREALSAIAKHRDEYIEAKSRSALQEARIGTDPPQLTADLEAAAREENVPIAESSERPNTPAGRRYVEHDVDLKIREVDLQTLSKFLRRVETGPRLVFFTRLTIKRRYSEADKLDVEATATAFERVKEDKTKKRADGKAGKGSGSGQGPGKDE